MEAASRIHRPAMDTWNWSRKTSKVLPCTMYCRPQDSQRSLTASVMLSVTETCLSTVCSWMAGLFTVPWNSHIAGPADDAGAPVEPERHLRGVVVLLLAVRGLSVGSLPRLVEGQEDAVVGGGRVPSAFFTMMSIVM